MPIWDKKEGYQKYPETKIMRHSIENVPELPQFHPSEARFSYFDSHNVLLQDCAEKCTAVILCLFFNR